MALIVAGTLALTGCEGGGSSGGSDTEQVYRVYDNDRSNYALVEDSIENLNLLANDGINDNVGYRDFNSEQEAINYTRPSSSGSSDSTNDDTPSSGDDGGSSTPSTPSGPSSGGGF